MSESTAAALMGDNSAAAAGAPTSTAEPAAAPAAPATPAAPAEGSQAAGNWYSGADELTTGYIQNKGWQTPLDAIKSYQNLEKVLGADRAGRTVVMPGDNATPEERNAFFEKLGRPTDPAGYNLQVPEGFGDKEFAGEAGKWFHELGLSKAQGEQLVSRWNEYVGNRVGADQAIAQQTYEQDQSKLTQEWGAAYAQNLAAAQTAARNLGLEAETIDKLQAALGHYGTMNLLSKIGSKTTEAPFVSGDGSNGFGDAMTPAQAKAEIKALMSDREFFKQYTAKNADAVSKMERLHRFAYPE